MAKTAFLQTIENRTFQRLVLFIALSVIGYILYKRIKARVEIQTADYKSSNLEEENSYYKALALRLYKGFKGLNWGVSARETLLNELNSLNDDEFKLVYNNFNRLAAGANDGTLRNWIVDEYLPGVDAKKAALSRMDRLNLP